MVRNTFFSCTLTHPWHLIHSLITAKGLQRASYIFLKKYIYFFILSSLCGDGTGAVIYSLLIGSLMAAGWSGLQGIKDACKQLNLHNTSTGERPVAAVCLCECSQ